MSNGLPTVPVDDLQIHPRDHDLILATHGRSLWIMDDISPLEQMSDNMLTSDLHLFDSRPGTTWHLANTKSFTGAQEFIADNAPYGVTINYFLKSKPEGRNPVRITISDKAGNRIRQLNVAGEAGINRAEWDLRYDSPLQGGGFGGRGGGGGGGGRGVAPTPEGAATAEAPGAQNEAGAEAPGGAGAGRGAGGGGGGGLFGFGGGRGPLVDPGEYTVAIAVLGKTETKTVVVEEDPRVSMPAEERTRRRQAITKLYAMAKDADSGRRKIVALRTSLTTLTDAWKRPGAPVVPDGVKKAANDLLAKVKDVVPTFEVEREGQLGGAGPPLKFTPPPVNQKITRLMGSIDAYSAAPTVRQMGDIDQASTELQSGLAVVKKLTDEDLPRLNKMMADAGVPYVTVETGTPQPPGRRGGR